MRLKFKHPLTDSALSEVFPSIKSFKRCFCKEYEDEADKEAAIKKMVKK